MSVHGNTCLRQVEETEVRIKAFSVQENLIVVLTGIQGKSAFLAGPCQGRAEASKELER